jgi:hypothetical protein
MSAIMRRSAMSAILRRTFVVATRVDKGDDLNGLARHAVDEAVGLNEDLADVDKAASRVRFWVVGQIRFKSR